MSVEKYPTKSMLGVREIVDGKVNSVFLVNFCHCYCFCQCENVLLLLSHSFVAWQVQVANLPRGVRHGGQGWKFHSCLWLWGGE